jgi:hypothetical protein
LPPDRSEGAIKSGRNFVNAKNKRRTTTLSTSSLPRRYVPRNDEVGVHKQSAAQPTFIRTALRFSRLYALLRAIHQA